MHTRRVGINGRVEDKGWRIGEPEESEGYTAEERTEVFQKDTRTLILKHLEWRQWRTREQASR